MESSPPPDHPPESQHDGWLSGMGGAQRYLGIGIQAGVSVVFYLVVGLLLDKWLNTFPWLMLVGILFGVAGMFAIFVRMTKELNHESEERKRQKKTQKN